MRSVTKEMMCSRTIDSRNVLVRVASIEPGSEVGAALDLHAEIHDQPPLVLLVPRDDNTMSRKLVVDVDHRLQRLVQVLLEPKISWDLDVIPTLLRRLTRILVLQPSADKEFCVRGRTGSRSCSHWW